MFNFLKRVKSINLDQAIYRDVYSAQELLLAEANKILSQNIDTNSEKNNRLEQLGRLGFSQADEVKSLRELKAQVAKQGEIKDYITYYNQNYPLNKFINEDAVSAICKKYGLLLASASDYTAEIPEENQKHIINFRIKRKDTNYSSTWYLGIENLVSNYINGDPFREMFQPFNSGLRMKSMEYPAYTQEPRNPEEMLEGTSLKIIAPEHKLDMRNKEKVGHTLKIKDPIVLQPVKGGYLIVTSWGLEASDELVSNPRLS